PMKMASAPHFFTKASPRGSNSGCRDSGHMLKTACSSLSPIQYDSQSPHAAPTEAATHTPSNVVQSWLTIAPIAINAPQAGSSSEMKASDSTNASTNITTG